MYVILFLFSINHSNTYSMPRARGGRLLRSSHVKIKPTLKSVENLGKITVSRWCPCRNNDGFAETFKNVGKSCFSQLLCKEHSIWPHYANCGIYVKTLENPRGISFYMLTGARHMAHKHWKWRFSRKAGKPLENQHFHPSHIEESRGSLSRHDLML